MVYLNAVHMSLNLTAVDVMNEVDNLPLERHGLLCCEAIFPEVNLS